MNTDVLVKRIFFFTFVFYCSIRSVYSSNILAIFPTPLKSHFIVFDALLIELANRGHNVTVVTPFIKSKQITNYNEIDATRCLKIPDEFFKINYTSNTKSGVFQLLKSFKFAIQTNDEIIRCECLQQLIHTNDTYDLLITELFITDVFLAYTYKFQKPFIMVCTLPILPWGSFKVGETDNPSYIPVTFNDISFDRNGPTFVEKLYNVAVYLTAMYHYYWEWIPQTDEVIRRHFGESYPSAHEISKNVSLILTFSHFSLNLPRPHVPAVIEVGGLHIKKPHPLPQDIENFINESKDGVIYFSFGSLLNGSSMSIEARNAITNAFKQISQRVLWKWELDDLPNKPINIMTKKWMPQRDILAHPKVKLFITHGGALGINEAVYEGVPIIGIPFYADQMSNIKTMINFGVGETLPYSDITTENFLDKIKTVINNKTYEENAKRLSMLYKDRPMSAMKTAVYWTEYVIRHNGARHLRTAALDLSWYQYLLLDIISLFIIILLILFLFIKIGLSYLISYIRNRFQRKNKKFKKQ